MSTLRALRSSDLSAARASISNERLNSTSCWAENTGQRIVETSGVSGIYA